MPNNFRYKKHIILLIDSMYGGGAERTVIELLNNLDQLRYTLSLALFNLTGDYMRLIPNHVSIIDLSSYAARRSLLKRIWGIRKMVEEYRPDIIISGLGASNLSLMRATPFIGKKCRTVITEHNNLTLSLQNSRKGLMNKAKNLEIRLLYPLANHIITVSNGVKNDLVSNFGILRDHVSVIHDPVDVTKVQMSTLQHIPTDWKALKTVKTIVAVGRLVPQKGYKDIIRAFANIQKLLPCRLLILGEGPLRTELESLVASLSLEGSVFLPGFVDNPWAIMSHADVYVSASHWEGFHLTIVEAMACGIPVIATDCDYGPGEIIEHGVNGLLVPVGDVDGLTIQIQDLLSNEPKRIYLARNGQKRAHDFDSKLIAHRYEQLINELGQ